MPQKAKESSIVRLALGAILVATWGSLASAAPVTYVGFDLGAEPGDAHPNSTAVAVSFNAAAAPLGLRLQIDLESSKVEYLPYIEFPTGIPAPGATANIAPGVKA